MSAIELLNKAEVYERAARQRPAKSEFLRLGEIRTRQTHNAGVLSGTQLLNWLEGYGMAYPMVPILDDQNRCMIVMLIDSSSNRVQWVSSNVDQVLGYARDELIETPFAETFCRRQVARLRAMFAAPQDGQPTRIAPTPLRLLHRDGHTIRVQLQAGYGERSGAWYVQLTVLDEPAHHGQNSLPTSADQVFNVGPYVLRPTVLDSTEGSAPRLVISFTEHERDMTELTRAYLQELTDDPKLPIEFSF